MTGSALFDAGVGVVVVDALEVFGLYFVPVDMGNGVQSLGHVADEVLDKYRILVGSFGDGLFIWSFEQCVQFATGGFLHQGNEVFYPESFRRTELHGDLAALVMCSLFADGFGAGAKCGDVHSHLEQKIDLRSIRCGVKTSHIIHETLAAGDGRALFEEEWELHFQMRGVRLEFALHGLKDHWDFVHVNGVAMRVQHFDETAHVRPFEFFWQVNIHANRGHCVLKLVRLVANLDWMQQAAHADFVDPQVAVIALVLLVE